MALTSSGGLEVQILYRTLDGHQVFRQIEEFACQRDFCLIHLLFISCTLSIQAPYYHADIRYLKCITEFIKHSFSCYLTKHNLEVKKTFENIRKPVLKTDSSQLSYDFMLN